MGEKINSMITIGIICAIILVFTAADFMNDDRVFSETENRVLASKPKLSKEKVLSGEFSEEYEKYVTDQFVGRDKWVSIKTSADVLLQKKDINGVYLGKDEYLIEQHKPEDFTTAQEDKKLALLKALVDEWDATVMLVPTADNVITDKLPAHAAYYDQKAFLERVREVAGEDHYVDVYTVLQEHAQEDVYYRTDHHWTSLGAYYGYQAWAEATDKAAHPYDVSQMQTVTEDFLGTLHSKLNLPWRTDAIQIFPETKENEISITYDFQKKTQSYYEDSYLDTKNKYGYFLDDNHGLLEIQTGSPADDTLFVIKDSYANCLIPLLAPHYKTIYVVDLRYFNGKLFPFIKQYQPTDVLVLYNCVHFLEEFQYVK